MEHVPALRVDKQLHDGLERLSRGLDFLSKRGVLLSTRSSLETTASSITSLGVPQLTNAASFFGVRSRLPVSRKKAPRSRSIVLNNRLVPENLLLDRPF